MDGILQFDGTALDAVRIMTAIEDGGIPYGRNAAVYAQAKTVWAGTSTGARRSIVKSLRKQARREATAARRRLSDYLASGIGEATWAPAGYSHCAEGWKSTLLIDGVETPLYAVSGNACPGSGKRDHSRCTLCLAVRTAAGPMPDGRLYPSWPNWAKRALPWVAEATWLALEQSWASTQASLTEAR